MTYSAEYAVDMVSILNEGEMEEGQEQEKTLLSRFKKDYDRLYPDRKKQEVKVEKKTSQQKKVE